VLSVFYYAHHIMQYIAVFAENVIAWLDFNGRSEIDIESQWANDDSDSYSSSSSSSSRQEENK